MGLYGIIWDYMGKTAQQVVIMMWLDIFSLLQ